MSLPKKTLRKKLVKKDFSVFYGEVAYFRRIFGENDQYEIALEPCDFGFDVAIYKRTDTFSLLLVCDKRCTDHHGYTEDKFHTHKRSEETWNTALSFAEEMIELYLPKER